MGLRINLNGMSTETLPVLGRDEADKVKRVELREFEGIKIQTERGRWSFLGPEGKTTSLDTYSIWDKNSWEEIAQRLARGETCAMYVAGTYGVGRVFYPPNQSEDPEGDLELFEIKKRSRDQNFVAFIHPDDQIEVIDVQRLSPQLAHLESAEERKKTYAWAQHNVYPAKDDGTINEAIIRGADQSIACFWIPNHWGFEGLNRNLREIREDGILGGGSLNIHGQEPSYTTDDLYASFLANPDWQEKIDFIIFDEISEAGQIGRSQPMISFTGEKPLVLRHGSLSVEKISARTGYEIEVAEGVRYASSTTPYNPDFNREVDSRVTQVEAMIERFRQSECEIMLDLQLPQFSPVPHLQQR